MSKELIKPAESLSGALNAIGISNKLTVNDLISMAVTEKVQEFNTSFMELKEMESEIRKDIRVFEESIESKVRAEVEKKIKNTGSVGLEIMQVDTCKDKLINFPCLINTSSASSLKVEKNGIITLSNSYQVSVQFRVCLKGFVKTNWDSDEIIKFKKTESFNLPEVIHKKAEAYQDMVDDFVSTFGYVPLETIRKNIKSSFTRKALESIPKDVKETLRLQLGLTL